MTEEQKLQKTARGETFGDLLRRALADWEPAVAIDAREEETRQEGDSNASR